MKTLLLSAALLAFGCTSSAAPAPSGPCKAFLEGEALSSDDALTCAYVAGPKANGLSLRVDRPDGQRLAIAFALDPAKLQQATSYDLPADGLKVVAAAGPGSEYKPGGNYPGLCASPSGSMYFEDLATEFAVFFDLKCADGRAWSGWLHGIK